MLPLVCAGAIGVHSLESRNELPVDAGTYTTFLEVLLSLAALASASMFFWRGLRNWLEIRVPLLAGVVVLLCAWETITAGLRLLPLPYFPGPASVLQNFLNDRALLLDSTWHSLILLSCGYTVGVTLGLVTGICIGWSLRVRYWGMPVLKTLGPIPATAWIPLAMVLAPSSTLSAMGLIALAVWFPV